MITDNLITLITINALWITMLSQAIKKLLDEENIKYSSNLIVGLITIVFGVFSFGVHCIMHSIPISITTITYGIVVIIGSWIASMVGYDKVAQLLKQIKDLK